MLKSAEGESHIVLADEPPFNLGSLRLEPALRQISWEGETRTIEPKLMQILVALAQAKGRIVSRETLIDRCWDGRFVGDNAVNRVLSRARVLAAETAAFDLETIIKVGYRLTARDAPGASLERAAPPLAASLPFRRINRRWALLAGAGAFGAAAGLYGWIADRSRDPPEEAVRLTQHALDGFRISEGEPDPRVVAELQEAVRIAPDYAEAWGGLAAVYVEHYFAAPLPQREGLKSRAESAAARALALDPREPRASIALLQMTKTFGHWKSIEDQCRRLLSISDRHPLVVGSLANVLQEVGRWSDSVPLLDEVNRKLVTNPIGHYKHVLALWGSGQVEAAEQALERAVRRFPRHPGIWHIQLNMLMYGGRPDDAMAFARNPSVRPANSRDEDVTPLVATATAIASGKANDARAAIDVNLKGLPETGQTFSAVHCCAVLGDRESAFALLRGYFEGAGQWAALMPPKDGSEGECWTSALFQPPARSLWADSRFERLLDSIGLRNYWRRSGAGPDYLRLA